MIGTLSVTDGENYGLTGVIGAGVERNGANSYRIVSSFTDFVEPLPDLPEIPPGPFFGSPMPVPTDGDSAHPFDSLAPNGRIWASDYDYGGEGVAYHDTGAINLGEAYRPDEAVDVQSSAEGYTMVGFFETGEWLEYTIDVAQAGNYQMTLRTASASGVGGFISVESDCRKLTGNIPTPNTGGWDTWQDITVDITLKAGIQKLRIVSGGGMNLMNFDIQLGGDGGADYGEGCEWVPPEPDDIKVEAEEWTSVVSAPNGTVSIGASTDSDLSDHVGNFDAGDYIEWDVNVPADGCYIASYRVASQPGSLGFELRFGDELVDTFNIPPTGGWSNWVTFNRPVTLSEGPQTMRLEALGDSFNLNWLAFNQTDEKYCEDDGAIIIEAEYFTSSIQSPEGDIGTQGTEDEGGGLNVGWIDAGDWMEYALIIPSQGNYAISYRAASQNGSNPGIMSYIDGNLVDSTAVPATGGWQSWTTVQGGIITLDAGEYVLRVSTTSGGFNLNWLKFTPTDEMPTGDIGTGSDSILNIGEIITFNDVIVDYDIVDFGNNNSYLTTDPVDSTNTVVATTNGNEPASGTTIARGQVIYPLTEALTRISIRIYSPEIGIPIRVKLEESGNPANSVETESMTTLANAWETIIFDFNDTVPGTPELNTSYVFDTLSVFFNFGSEGSGETYYWDDVIFLDEYVAPVTLTREMLIGGWKLAPEYGAMGVGPQPGDTSFWVIDSGAVAERACLFDDIFSFSEDGTFENLMGGETWIESWQGVSQDGCGVPVTPHDGSVEATFSYDDVNKVITLYGVGAHIGIPKVVSDAPELGDPADAPDSIVYQVFANTSDTMTLVVAYSGGYWTFKLVRDDSDGSTEPDDGSRSLYSLVSDGMIEARATEVNNTPGLANGISNSASGSSLSLHGDNLSGNESWKLNVGEWYGGSDGNFGMTVGVMVFQLPNFGEIANPFSTAELEVTIAQKGGQLDFPADLWAVRTSDTDNLVLADWFIGPFSNAPNGGEAGVLVQESFLIPSVEIGQVTTSDDANVELVNYLNAAYNSGSGAGKYLFFRVNKGDQNSFVYGWNAYVLKSSQAEEGEETAPEIKYTSVVDPIDLPDSDPEPEPSVPVGQNLISNAGFDNSDGWSVVNQYESDNTMGTVLFENGRAKFAETSSAVEGSWKHLGLYTELSLASGIYQFEMEINYEEVSDAWGEVYIGKTEPSPGAEYNGDIKVLKVFNSWECASVTTYSGNATETGCDTNSIPGRIEISSPGTYYLLFRTGGASYGNIGVQIDNMYLELLQ